jgi:hypothetical protein
VAQRRFAFRPPRVFGRRQLSRPESSGWIAGPTPLEWRGHKRKGKPLIFPQSCCSSTAFLLPPSNVSSFLACLPPVARWLVLLRRWVASCLAPFAHPPLHPIDDGRRSQLQTPVACFSSHSRVLKGIPPPLLPVPLRLSSFSSAPTSELRLARLLTLQQHRDQYSVDVLRC